MVILHIANIQPDVLGGVNIAVPKMIEAQSQFATVGLLNLTGSVIASIPTFSLKEFQKQQLPQIFKKPDLVVFHEVYRPAFLKVAHYYTARGIPYLIIPHGCLTKTAQKQKRFKKLLGNLLLFSHFLKQSHAIQYLSHQEQEQSCFDSTSFVAENGIGLPTRQKEKVLSDTISLIYIGRLDWHIKGLDLLLGTFSHYKDWFREHGVSLSLYGPNNTKEHSLITQFIQKHSLQDLVYLHHEIVGIDKENALLAADYFIQTSRTEGMPIGLLEALSYGLPAIVTEGTGFAQIVTKKNCGYGAQTTQEGIFFAIKSAITNHVRYSELSKNARILISNTLEKSLVAKKAVSYYQTIVSTSKS